LLAGINSIATYRTPEVEAEWAEATVADRSDQLRRAPDVGRYEDVVRLRLTVRFSGCNVAATLTLDC
jgi:hypothetical protein